jgi:hypothetical protein
MLRMPSLMRGVALLIICAGCSSTGPMLPEPTTGSWGGSRFSVQATETGVLFRLTCSGVHAAEPLRMDAAGRFSLDGELRTSQGPVARVTVSGVVRGDTLEVEVVDTRAGGAGTTRHSAVRNQPRDEGGGYYCPA